MPAWQKPDPAAEIGKLKREVEELARIVRRGKPAPNMRDLADGKLAKASGGQVPVYDAASGTWKPGSGGGVPSVLVGTIASFNAPTATYTSPTTYGPVYTNGGAAHFAASGGVIELLGNGSGTAVYSGRASVEFNGEDGGGFVRELSIQRSFDGTSGWSTLAGGIARAHTSTLSTFISGVLDLVLDDGDFLRMAVWHDNPATMPIARARLSVSYLGVPD